MIPILMIYNLGWKLGKILTFGSPLKTEFSIQLCFPKCKDFRLERWGKCSFIQTSIGIKKSNSFKVNGGLKDPTPHLKGVHLTRKGD